MAEADLGEVGSPRCLFATGVLRLVGMSDTEAAPYFFPYDTPAYQKAMGAAFESRKTSSCGVATEVGWRYAGVDAPLLYEPYAQRVAKGKFAVVAEQMIAQQNKAWVSGIPWVEGTPLPDIGDAPIIGCTSCGAAWARGVSNLEHEYTILAYDPAGHGIHHSVDGGQPGVKLRTRALVEVWTGHDGQGRRTGELWAAAVTDGGKIPLGSDGRPATGRRFVGYTSVVRLPLGDPEGPCWWSSGDGSSASASRGKRVLAVTALAAAAFLAARAWKRR